MTRENVGILMLMFEIIFASCIIIPVVFFSIREHRKELARNKRVITLIAKMEKDKLESQFMHMEQIVNDRLGLTSTDIDDEVMFDLSNRMEQIKREINGRSWDIKPKRKINQDLFENFYHGKFEVIGDEEKPKREDRS